MLELDSTRRGVRQSSTGADGGRAREKEQTAACQSVCESLALIQSHSILMVLQIIKPCMCLQSGFPSFIRPVPAPALGVCSSSPSPAPRPSGPLCPLDCKP